MAKEPKRLVLEVTDQMHAKIKARATARFMTIRGYILQTVIARMKTEDMYDREIK